MIRIPTCLCRAAALLFPALLLAATLLAAALLSPRTEKVRAGTVLLSADGPATIYLPRNADPTEVRAAEELAHYLSEMCGRPAKIAREGYCFRPEGIYVGRTAEAEKHLGFLFRPRPFAPAGERPKPVDSASPRLMQPDGPDDWDTVAWYSGNGKLVIAGIDPAATLLAVDRFLGREGGVRWWTALPSGEDVPSRSLWILPPGFVTERPSFVSRGFWLGSRPESYLWARRNLSGDHVSMNHSLQGILTPEVARAHPDWFPKFGGKPYDPASWKGPVPQPLFTNEAMSAFVADSVIDFFRTHPNAPTYSISPSDNSLFGDQSQYAGLIPEDAVFRGRADYSNAVCTYYNAVARRVAEKYPDRHLGALAYAFWENVPSFPVEKNVVPYLTADRSQWYDPVFKAEDLALVRRWTQAGPELVGTWDYLYGSPFLMPRVLLKVTRETLPSLREAGVRAYYAELLPLWGFDAPKGWVTLQLLWDTTQDPAALQDEFFRGYFGPAEVPMRRFFEGCDAVWMRQSGRAYWIKFYGNTDQAALFSADDMRSLRACIDEALAMPLDAKHRARVELVSEAFRLSERLYAAREADRAVSAWNPGREAAALATALPAFMEARRDMHAMNETFATEKDPNYLYGRLGYLEDDDPLPGRLVFAMRDFDAATLTALREAAPDEFPAAPGVCILPLYPTPFDGGLRHWRITAWPDPTMRYAMTGSRGAETLRVDKANTLCLTLTARIQAGAAYYAPFSTEGRISPGATVRLLLEYLDASGKRLAFASDRLPCGTLSRQLLCVAGTAPEGTVRARLSLTFLYMREEGDFVEIGAWKDAK